MAVSTYAERRREYEAKKAESNEAHAIMEEAENRMLSMLETVGKSKYHVDEVGTVQVISKLVVQTPKTPEDKGLFFKYIKEKLGAEGFLTYATVNHNSLQSLYKTLFEEAENKETFSIDGIGQPTERKELRFKKL